jgi:hypothetical protein
LSRKVRLVARQGGSSAGCGPTSRIRPSTRGSEAGQARDVRESRARLRMGYAMADRPAAFCLSKIGFSCRLEKKIFFRWPGCQGDQYHATPRRRAAPRWYDFIRAGARGEPRRPGRRWRRRRLRR